MLVLVHGKGFNVTPALRNLVERKLSFALDRMGHRIRSVRVRLEDMNGPRGGVDKRCTIQIRGERGWGLLTTFEAPDVLGALTGATDRLEQAVTREIERRRDRDTDMDRARKQANGV